MLFVNRPDFISSIQEVGIEEIITQNKIPSLGENQNEMTNQCVKTHPQATFLLDKSSTDVTYSDQVEEIWGK